ncbi:M28 family peptidase [Dysgonomonas sp. 511]|uniref:M28 family peptidase n=1 Tax=Dysgonomonas sp. 511 TaxID=2302930 RepID=UPI0013D22EE1|nr:M28 family peptidase [Dysgonomonas sp. 511]NDV80201.1 glutamine cyclotransferase [Dysgonomonas sp. 511]
MTAKNITAITCAFLFIACSCGKTSQNNNTTPAAVSYEKVAPNFSSDSAYAYIDKQVSFGPRVPNTAQHVACGDYLVSELKRFGAEVTEQKMVVAAYDGTKLNARNIIGTYGADKKNRVLLFAHWDTRPYSDHDPDKANYNKPLLGANDGGSGVGVLLEVARVLQSRSPEIGVDIIFFDAEDYGVPYFAAQQYKGDSGKTWCLGSRYWSENPHIPNYKAKFGILLDMVGTEGATFYREYYSHRYARNVLDKVWTAARQLGHSKYFINKEGGGVTDDHVPVNEIRRVPSIDIIDYRLGTENGFFHSWHTQKDDMSNISKETLKAVGETVLEVIYKEM